MKKLENCPEKKKIEKKNAGQGATKSLYLTKSVYPKKNFLVKYTVDKFQEKS